MPNYQVEINIVGKESLSEPAKKAETAIETLAATHGTLAERVSAFVGQAASEINAVRAKESAIGALSAKYVEAAAALEEWIKENGRDNVQTIEKQAALDKMALGIRKQAEELTALQNSNVKAEVSSGSLFSELSKLPGPLGDISGKLAGVSAESFTAIGVIGGVATATAALASFVKNATDQYLDYSQSVMRAADITGTSTEFISRFTQAADDASIAARGQGVSVDGVSFALQRYAINLGRGVDEQGNMTDGAKRMVDALGRLGVSQAQAENASGDEEKSLMLLADAFQRNENATLKLQIATQLFGRTGRDLIPILEQGSAGIKALMDGVDGGLVVTEQGAAGVKRYAAALDTLNDKMDAVKNRIGAPVVEGLATFLAQATAEMDAFGGEFEVFNARINQDAQKTGEALDKQIKNLDLAGRAADKAYADYLRNSAEYTNWLGRQADAQRYAGIADAYAAQQKIELDARIKAATNSYQDFGEWALKSADSELRGAEITKAVAEQQKAAADATRQREAAQNALNSAMQSGAGSPIKSTAPTNLEKFQMATSLTQEGVGNFEAKLFTQAEARAAELGVSLDKLVPIYKRLQDHEITIAEAFDGLNKIVPPNVKNQFAPYLAAMQDVERQAGVVGDVGSFAFGKKSVLVKATESDLRELDILNGQLAQKLAERKKLADSAQIWGDANGKGANAMPSGWSEARIKGDLAELDKAIAEIERKKAEYERKKAGYAVQVTTFDDANSAAIDVATQRLQAMARAYSAKNSPAAQVGDVATKTVAQAMTDGAPVINSAFQTAVMGAYNWTKTPEYRGMWEGAAKDLVGIIADTIRQNAFRIQDAFSAAMSGLKAQLIRDVIDALRRGG